MVARDRERRRIRHRSICPSVARVVRNSVIVTVAAQDPRRRRRSPILQRVEARAGTSAGGLRAVVTSAFKTDDGC